ncbi:HD domain-containing protein, partial [Xylella fastidiosa subsp. multiplex]|nr:HD domain-containing protein [Xylella fastidiosa subsp. multiplex]
RLIQSAAPLHDIGNIAIPDAALIKRRTLNEEEMAMMRRHPSIGCELLSGSQNRSIQLGALIALRHDERYGGSGYQDGLV